MSLDAIIALTFVGRLTAIFAGPIGMIVGFAGGGIIAGLVTWAILEVMGISLYYFFGGKLAAKSLN